MDAPARIRLVTEQWRPGRRANRCDDRLRKSGGKLDCLYHHHYRTRSRKLPVFSRPVGRSQGFGYLATRSRVSYRFTKVSIYKNSMYKPYLMYRSEDPDLQRVQLLSPNPPTAPLGRRSSRSGDPVGGRRPHHRPPSGVPGGPPARRRPAGRTSPVGSRPPTSSPAVRPRLSLGPRRAASRSTPLAPRHSRSGRKRRSRRPNQRRSTRVRPSRSPPVLPTLTGHCGPETRRRHRRGRHVAGPRHRTRNRHPRTRH